MGIIGRLFKPVEEPKTVWAVLCWWELRRIPYNVLLVCVGLPCYLLLLLIAGAPGLIEPGEDIVEPMIIIVAPVLFNIAYTFGWLAEIFLVLAWRDRSVLVGPILFKLGVSFTVICIALPTGLWGLAAMAWLING